MTTGSSADPASHMELAGEAMLSGDIDGVVAHLSAAVRAFTEANEKRQAAMASAQLGDVFANRLGNKTAARVAFLRAIRLVENEPPCVEQGWAAVAAMGCDVDDPAVGVERAALALDRARRFSDVDLETKALADGGLAHVQAGRVREGMAMMDEAMALACGGGATDESAVGKSVCSFYSACYYTADFERFETWSRLMRQLGIIGAAGGTPSILNSHCHSVQGVLLCHLGRWGEAEDVLVRAYDAIEEAMPGSAWHPPIALAELRIFQGRLAEAEILLIGRDDHIQALLPMARLHLARRDFELARATARRGLRMMGDDCVRSAALLGVLVEAELGRGNAEEAAAASADLDSRTVGLGLPALGAEAARLRSRVLAVNGNLAGGITALQDALGQLADTDLWRLRATLHLDVARLHEAIGDQAEAVVEARACAALLARLDVVIAPDDSALLQRLGVSAATHAARVECRVATLTREGSWWTAGCGDMNVRLHDTKGLRYLADLIARPGRERHALDLVDIVEGVAAAGSGADGIDRRKLGSAGELLDPRTRATYRRRVEELRLDVEDALAIEDDDRAFMLQAELDAVVAELARAFGLGGRERVASDAAEKARLNVTRALRAAIIRLAEALPDAGAMLDRRVRTGMFCAYEPHPDDEAVWSVQPRLNGQGRD